MFPFEQGALEMVLIGALALIVLGPKDLPIVMRRIGQFMAKMRGMAAEFRASFDELARQSELDELRKEVEALRRGDHPASELDPVGFSFPPQPIQPEPAAEPMADVAPTETASADAHPVEAPAPARKPRARRAKASPVPAEASTEETGA